MRGDRVGRLAQAPYRVIIIISIVEGRDEGEGLVGREVCIRVMLEVVEVDILTDLNSTVGVFGNYCGISIDVKL